jgi:hypothetical protein
MVRIVSVPSSVARVMPSETVALFRRIVGKTLRVDGFGPYGHLEFNVRHDGSQAADRSQHTVWLEPEFVEAVGDADDNDLTRRCS